MDFARKLILVLNKIIPKDDNLVVVSSRPDYSDSALNVYNYMRKNTKYNKYKLVWITYNNTGINCPENAVHFTKRSIKGILTYLRAKYVFSTHGLYAGTVVHNQIHVGITHSMPVKKFKAYLLQPGQHLKKEYTFSFATSETYRKVIAKCYELDLDEVMLLGLPRNDDLLHPDDSLKKLGIPEDSKVITWLPTFRSPQNISEEHNVCKEGTDYELGIPFWDSSNISELDSLLSILKVHLIIKYHMLQRLNNVSLPKLGNVHFLTANDCTDKKIVLYRLLACGNALITDYSSVYVDYLATDKPMAFVLDDIEKYTEDRGFIFENPVAHMPGVIINSKAELLNFINSVASEDDNYKGEREKARPELNIFQDDKNTERVVDYVFNQNKQ